MSPIILLMMKIQVMTMNMKVNNGLVLCDICNKHFKARGFKRDKTTTHKIK